MEGIIYAYWQTNVSHNVPEEQAGYEADACYYWFSRDFVDLKNDIGSEVKQASVV